MPSARAAQDRVKPRRLPKAAVELEVIDAPAPPPVDIHELIVQDAVHGIHAVGNLGHQPELF